MSWYNKTYAFIILAVILVAVGGFFLANSASSSERPENIIVNNTSSNVNALNSTTINSDNDTSFIAYESNLSLPVPLNGSISKEQAIQIAEHTDYFKNFIPGTVDVRQTVGYDTGLAIGDGPQRQIWLVDIVCYFNRITPEGYTINDHHGGQVLIDMVTGDVLSVNPCF